RNVTGVQTCALPIFSERVACSVQAASIEEPRECCHDSAQNHDGKPDALDANADGARASRTIADRVDMSSETAFTIKEMADRHDEIGRASCRERGES